MAKDSSPSSISEAYERKLEAGELRGDSVESRSGALPNSSENPTVPDTSAISEERRSAEHSAPESGVAATAAWFSMTEVGEAADRRGAGILGEGRGWATGRERASGGSGARAARGIRSTSMGTARGRA